VCTHKKENQEVFIAVQTKLLKRGCYLLFKKRPLTLFWLWKNEVSVHTKENSLRVRKKGVWVRTEHHFNVCHVTEGDTFGSSLTQILCVIILFFFCFHSITHHGYKNTKFETPIIFCGHAVLVAQPTDLSLS
jgi:hypothetical protein